LRHYLWVDTKKIGPESWEIFRPYWESAEIKKVWHNYSFDRHVIENHGGIKLQVGRCKLAPIGVTSA